MGGSGSLGSVAALERRSGLKLNYSPRDPFARKCMCAQLAAPPFRLSLRSPIRYPDPQHLAAKACKEDISLGD